MGERVFTFVEPHPTGGHCTVSITGSQIIRYMNKHIKEKIQKKHPDMEITDELLIEEFCVIHWCSEEKS